MINFFKLKHKRPDFPCMELYIMRDDKWDHLFNFQGKMVIFPSPFPTKYVRTVTHL